MKTHTLLTVAEAAALIDAGKVLALAGDEALLAQLPKGHWIGGTIPYFIADQGGTETRERLYASELTQAKPSAIALKTYTLDTIARIASDAPDNGYTIVILPAGSAIHTEYANHGRDYADMFIKPIVGWIAGVHLDDLGRVAPKVVNGVAGGLLSEAAVALHVTLPAERMAEIRILNLFRQDPEGDVITFAEAGFSASACLVNGKPAMLADYIAARGLDLKLPLVADYHGASINTSFQGVDADGRTVRFYAPVFPGIEYRQAAPLGDYVQAFEMLAGGAHGEVEFSCNCVLNYLYGELRGRRTGDLYGPATFGEVAYQLLNQTLVYLDVHTPS
ncbi:DUF6976 family protein [Duganella radicis]|uniref:Uncharacterized protein n=1 Tax=Duganella radicis TaxID=551988 RepID=A0A6L6PCC9_9BURK|nr:hypothetical protein [Duganella radicis]MTV36251.1 hypothetical protein [Duganella radicis]